MPDLFNPCKLKQNLSAGGSFCKDIRSLVKCFETQLKMVIAVRESTFPQDNIATIVNVQIFHVSHSILIQMDLKANIV